MILVFLEFIDIYRYYRRFTAINLIFSGFFQGWVQGFGSGLGFLLTRICKIITFKVYLCQLGVLEADLEVWSFWLGFRVQGSIRFIVQGFFKYFILKVLQVHKSLLSWIAYLQGLGFLCYFSLFYSIFPFKIPGLGFSTILSVILRHYFYHTCSIFDFVSYFYPRKFSILF